MKFLTIIPVAAILLASPALAQNGGFQGPTHGGFQGPAVQGKNVSISHAKKLADDMYVSLTGKVLSKLPGDDKYIFSDGTDKITVEIDDEVFQGRTLTPETTVRIHGKIDSDWGKQTEIDVKSFEIVGK